MADDERGFYPGLLAKGGRQVFGQNHAEKSYQRRLAFAQNDGASADDAEIGIASGGFDALDLFGRKHARKKSALAKCAAAVWQ